MSSIGQKSRSGSSSSSNSANLARIYSGQSSSANSRGNSSASIHIDHSPNNSQDNSNRFRDDRIHLSNVDLSDDEFSPNSTGNAHGVIRIEMQPKKLVRQRKDHGMIEERDYS